jgi:hypothetical protein
LIAENGTVDDTYSEGGIALFRVQGSGSDNMQALQVDAVCPVVILLLVEGIHENSYK